MDKVEKPKKFSVTDTKHKPLYELYYADEMDKWNNYVMQPIDEVWEKYKDVQSAPRYLIKLKFVSDMWNAIKESKRRREEG